MLDKDIYKFVQRPNYVMFGPNQELEELFCKICGTAIGGMHQALKGKRLNKQGVWIEEHVVRFRRFHNYAELKMEFQDGSAHVTNGCKTCLHENLTTDQLFELHIADMYMDGAEYTKGAVRRVPKKVVAVRTDGGGIT